MQDHPKKDILSQARDLYSDLADEARRSVQHDQQTARRRGTVTKVLLGVCLVASLLAAATLVYGVITFPDAPIRQTASGYIGKLGKSHTSEEYERFKLWEKIVMASFGVAVLAGLGAVVSGKLSRKARIG